MGNTVIRNLNVNEMYVVDELAAIDGRNPGLYDGEFLFRADNNGYFAAINGTEVEGTISSVNYDNDLGFIGFHIVVPHLRSNGIGEKLFSVAIDKAGDSNIGINCKEEETGFYEGFGFKPAYKIISYEGASDGVYRVPQNIVSPLMLEFDEFYKYYRKVFPYERKTFASYWINQPKSLALGKYENNEYKGVGLFKPCRKGYKLSPLICDDPQSAEEILTALTSHFESGTPYYIDIPEPNNDAVALAEKLNLKKVDERIRMYTQKEHDILLKNTYSFTSLEIG